jgi:hypothetical protein
VEIGELPAPATEENDVETKEEEMEEEEQYSA